MIALPQKPQNCTIHATPAISPPLNRSLSGNLPDMAVLMDLDAVSVGEAAKILKASVESVRLWAKQKVLKSFRTPGGHHRILRSSIEELQKQREREASE